MKDQAKPDLQIAEYSKQLNFCPAIDYFIYKQVYIKLGNWKLLNNRALTKPVECFIDMKKLNKE